MPKTTQQLPDEIGKSTKHMLSLFRLPGEPEESGRVHAYLANSYLTYLRSSRRQDELMSKYFHKPERSVEQSARLVGLSLPKRAE